MQRTEQSVGIVADIKEVERNLHLFSYLKYEELSCGLYFRYNLAVFSPCHAYFVLYYLIGFYDNFIVRKGVKADMRIQTVQGDITVQKDVEAIVNAANTSLLGGGGVDGAIHQAAGPELLKECRTLQGCNTGEAKITNGYNLPCKYVIHTVGPIYTDGSRGEADLLKNAYRNSLQLAVNHGIRTIAFPSISTGVYGYPVEAAAEIAVNTVKEFYREHLDDLDYVRFVLFDPKTRRAYDDAIMKSGMKDK